MNMSTIPIKISGIKDSNLRHGMVQSSGFFLPQGWSHCRISFLTPPAFPSSINLPTLVKISQKFYWIAPKVKSRKAWHPEFYEPVTTWWLIPLSKWVITCYNPSYKWINPTKIPCKSLGWTNPQPRAVASSPPISPPCGRPSRLVGGIPTYPSEKYDFVKWDDEIPNMMGKS